MSTRECLQYFEEYGASRVEWLDDSSCNIVFNDADSAKRAMVGKGRPFGPGDVQELKGRAQSACKPCLSRCNDPCAFLGYAAKWCFMLWKYAADRECHLSDGRKVSGASDGTSSRAITRRLVQPSCDDCRHALQGWTCMTSTTFPTSGTKERTSRRGRAGRR